MMFREMRRTRQLLSREDSIAILERGTSGVLAVSGDDGYPYAVPLSYVYQDGTLFFHSAVTGHKLDAIARSGKVSFCVIDQDQVVPETYTTHFRSVIAFGRARVLTDPAEARTALALLGRKYAPDQGEDALRAEMDKSFSHLRVIAVTIEHLTGKEAIELVPKKEKT